MKYLWSFFCFFPLFIYPETFAFEARGGYFLPAAKAIRDVYKSGGMEPEIEASARIYKDLRAWTNFNAFLRTGHSEGLNSFTSIQIYPLSLGLKYNIKLFNSFNMYLGVGPNFTWVKIHDHSPYVKEYVYKTAWGVVGKSGFIYQFVRNAFFDLFADYSYSKIGAVSKEGVESDSLNVGGLRAGLGLGISF
jgi:opacity protein-like surface antigen